MKITILVLLLQSRVYSFQKINFKEHSTRNYVKYSTGNLHLNSNKIYSAIPLKIQNGRLESFNKILAIIVYMLKETN